MTRKFRIDVLGRDGRWHFVTNLVRTDSVVARARMHTRKGNAVRIAWRDTGRLWYIDASNTPALPA